LYCTCADGNEAEGDEEMETEEVPSEEVKKLPKMDMATLRKVCSI